MSEARESGRRPWIAVVLSLFCTGLGHIYCGRHVRGLLLYIVAFLFVPAALLAAYATPSTGLLVLLLGFFLLIPVIYIAAAVDAFLVSRKVQDSYVPRRYNHPLVYLLVFLVGGFLPFGSAIAIRAGWLQAFRCAGTSMDPTLIRGDLVLVKKSEVDGPLPRRGEVIVHRCPEDRSKIFIKRVIGLPGDRVSVIENEVYINGEKLPREIGDDGILRETNGESRYRIRTGTTGTADFPEITVPENTLFVLGDNRSLSRDSRHFGSVPRADLLGNVAYIYLPVDSWDRFGPFADR